MNFIFKRIIKNNSRNDILYSINNLVPCGGNLVERNSTITSPNYPMNYPDNVTCLWKINAPLNHRIAIKINDFSSEICCDRLEIFRGNTTRNSIFLPLRRTSNPSYIFLNHNNIIIKFSSNIYGINRLKTSRGFSAEYKIISQDECMY